MKVPLIAAFLVYLLPVILTAESLTVSNPTKHPMQNALVRLNPESLLPETVMAVKGTASGQPAVLQVEQTGNGGLVWASVTLAPGERTDINYQPVKATPGPSALVERTSEGLLLRNEHVELLIPSTWSKGDPAPAPVLGVRSKTGGVRGQAAWSTSSPLLQFKSEVVGEGPLFAKVRVTYEFEAGTATVEITLPPDRPFAWIHEYHSMGKKDGWTFELTSGWEPDRGVIRRWFQGPFKGAPAEETFELKAGYTRLGKDVIHLQPRWTQSYDEGYSFGVTGAEGYLGALVVRAGQWLLPHDTKPVGRVPAQDTAELFLPTHRGARTWLLLAGSAELADKVPGILRMENVLNLDKLTHDYRLPFSDGEKKLIGGVDFYSNQTNPTGMMRQQNRRRLRDAQNGKTSNSLGALYLAQAFFDPDWYGRLEHGWSPINPNFYTDFIKGGIAITAQLRGHPEFPHIRKLAEEALRRDMVYAVTLPGGAGQECPGYQQHAMSAWKKLAPVCEKYLGFDPRTWPRYKEGARFLAKTSVPAVNGRMFHPAGDTHPGRPDPVDLAREYGVDENPKTWVSEEFPGFGVIFRHQSGTPNETYLSLKAGPNRGHYHGDQLSIHWVHHGEPLAVDHHASYKPRPGQEHMHNRVSVQTREFPYANMDGYERLIAFTSSDVADVAVTQVESPRIRKVKPLPPEEWDVSEPAVWYEESLKIRRTVIFLKSDPPMIILKDETELPEGMTPVWNLHVTGTDAKREGDWIDFGNAQVFLPAEPGDRFEALPWEHENGGLERTTAGRVFRPNGNAFVSVLVPGKDRPKMAVRAGRLVLADLGELEMGEERVRFFPNKGGPVDLLKPDDIDLDRYQGDVGLFVPDVGYPFGPVPDWLLKQRPLRR